MGRECLGRPGFLQAPLDWCYLGTLLQAVLSVTWPLTSELQGAPSHCVHPSSGCGQEPLGLWVERLLPRVGPLGAPHAGLELVAGQAGTCFETGHRAQGFHGHLKEAPGRTV